MKNKILRLLWLDDSQLRSDKTRIYGWIGVVVGTLLFAGTLIFYGATSSLTSRVDTLTKETIFELRSDPALPKGNHNIERAVKMLALYPEYMGAIPLAAALMLLGVSLSVVFQGVMYIRIHTVLNKQSPNQASQTIGSEASPQSGR